MRPPLRSSWRLLVFLEEETWAEGCVSNLCLWLAILRQRWLQVSWSDSSRWCEACRWLLACSRQQLVPGEQACCRWDEKGLQLEEAELRLLSQQLHLWDLLA